MLIRPMIVGDVAAVATIEAEFPSPWVESQVAAECERKSGSSFVAEGISHEIMGWCCGVLIAPEAELLKVAVASTWQRQGIATALLQKLCFSFTEEGGEQIFLEVRSRNDSALQFYQQLAWQRQGGRERYYQNPVDDAILLVRSLKA